MNIEENLVKYVPKKYYYAIDELYHDGYYYCGCVRPGYKVVASDSHIITGETIKEMLSEIRSIEVVGVDFEEMEYALTCESLLIDSVEKPIAWMDAVGKFEVGYECIGEVQFIVYVGVDEYKVYSCEHDEVVARKKTVIEVVEYLSEVLA